MYAMWITIGYLSDQARSRIGSTVKNEAGALTLEWIVIAVALVAAGGVAAALFTASIRNEAKNLP